jgi:DNA-binding IclR family transcriptional regulator
LATLTEHSIASPAELRSELERIQKLGYATDDEAVVLGVACVAAAVRTSHREDGLLAVSITASKDTLTPARTKAIRSTLSEMIKALQTRL